MCTPREYIEDIKSRQANSDKEFILDSLTGAIDRLQKAFPRYGSFLMEFVQNADDARSRSLKIEILENAIKISNDGLVFSEEDVKSICKVGRSSKTAKDYVGYLGVGFKAVFLISECPEIYSGGYRFRFDKSTWQDSEHIPWQIIPVWIDSPNVDYSEHKATFILPLKSPDLMEKIRDEVKPEHLNSRILLFLRHTEKIEITDVAQDFKRRIIKSEHSKTPDYEICKIQDYRNDELKSQDLRLVFRSNCGVPSDVRKDYTTKEWEREGVEKREILVAFQLLDEKNPIKEDKGTAHIGVFSFLPLKEIPSGLSFLLQADFLTTPGRGELARDCLWNNWLADEICDLVIRRCIPTFRANNYWKMNMTEFLYSSRGGHELFEKHIKVPLNEYLENSAVLIAEDGTPAKAEEMLSASDEIRHLLTNDDLESMCPDKKVMHKDCRPHRNLKITEAPKDVHSFVKSSQSGYIIKLKAKNEEVEWFKKLYSMFVDKYNYDYFCRYYSHYNVEHDRFWNRMHSLWTPVILTDDYNVTRIDDCYINPKKVSIPQQLREKFKIVHSQIAEDEGFEKFRSRLNEERYHDYLPTAKVIRELTEEDIRNALRREETLKMIKGEWESLSEEERIEKVQEMEKLRSEYTWMSPEDEDWPFQYDFLTLKSKTGEWEKPENLFFSREYKPEHNIETLIEKGILDFPLKFVNPIFIENKNDDEIREWRAFFEELGVDKIARSEKGKKKITQRVGVLAALRFEKKNKRVPRELGESEKPGYDIESKSESEERFIEAKGTSNSSHPIHLTANEFKALQGDKSDKYFVYVVTDALTVPHLRVTRGSKLLGIIPDVEIEIPFNKWLVEATEEEFRP